MKVALALAVLLTLAGPVSSRAAMAQSRRATRAVEPVPRVRITQSGVGRRAGLLLVLAPDSVVAEWPSGASEVIPRSAITKLELSSGRRHFPWRGAIAGLVIGGAMGKLLEMSVDRTMEERVRQGDAENCGPTPPAGCGLSELVRGSRTNGLMLPLAILSGGAGGAVLGKVGVERWRTVSDSAQPRRVGVLIDVSRQRTAIGLWHAR